MNRPTDHRPHRNALRRWLTAGVMLAAAILLGTLPTGAAQSDWTQLVPGIDYREFRLPDPNRVFVARMGLGHNSVTIDSTIRSPAAP